MPLDHLASLVDVGVFGNLKLTDLLGQHALRRNVELRQDARSTHVDHELSEARKSIGPSGSGVDDSGCASSKTSRVWLDTEMADSRKDMDVQIDQSRRDQPSSGIEDIARLALE